MARPQAPAVHVSTLPTVNRSTYPEPFSSRMGDRVKRRLGEAFGLEQYGVNLVTLGPGGQSSLRHWHTQEEELVYIMSGELVLVTDEGEQPVSAGMVVGFPGGTENGHHFVNRSDAPAQYLEVGTRLEADEAFYPDDDLRWLPDGRAGHKDGTPY
jgi:uncharacterized cupin superfamily protein